MERWPQHCFPFEITFAIDRRAQFSCLHYGHFPFVARKCDWVIVNEVIFENEYGFAATLLEEIEKPRIVDGGANIGTFALTMFNAFPDATVYSFEASQDTFDILRKNRELNPDLQWEVEHAALWRANEMIGFSNMESSASGKIGDGYGVREVVGGIDFDSVMLRVGGGIDLMKIDIEGAEDDFLCTGSAQLVNIGQLIVELHPPDCNVTALLNVIRARWSQVYEIPGRSSSKALILATDNFYDYPFFVWN